MTEGSLHYKDGVENNPWPKDVTASRTFRTLPAGKDAYNYRSKVLMGMAQTRVLNEPPSTTPKDAVTFSLPSITKPDTPEGIMMLSVLEMQSLLRSDLYDVTAELADKWAVLQREGEAGGTGDSDGRWRRRASGTIPPRGTGGSGLPPTCRLRFGGCRVHLVVRR